jgi:hypothetical protein
VVGRLRTPVLRIDAGDKERRQLLRFLDGPGG